MTLNSIEQLLDDWAVWKNNQENNGLNSLGYKKINPIYRAMHGELSTGIWWSSVIPDGVDIDSAMSIVDKAICGLSNRRREVLILEYCENGSQAMKAAKMLPPITQSMFSQHLYFALEQLINNPDVKFLLN